MIENPRTSALLERVILLLALLPVAVGFYIMCGNWTAVPYWDAWQTPGQQIASAVRGTLTIGELFSQHNEHRPFFPRLLQLPLALLMGWDVRREMALGFLLLCGGSLALYGLLRQTTGSGPTALMGVAVMNLLVFTPRQYENFLASTDGGSFLPTVALLCALMMNLSSHSLRTKAAVNAALAFVSTYTFGNGMLLWPLAFPLNAARLDGQARMSWWCPAQAAYLAVGAISIVAYFVGYEHPPLAPPPAGHLAQLPIVIGFLVRWLGAFFLLESAALIGTTALLLFAALGGIAAALAWRTGKWRAHYPWLVLGAYVLISGFVTARSRVEFGFQMAGHSRYAAYSVFFHVALVGLALTIYQQIRARPLWRRGFAAAGVIYISLLVLLSVSAFGRQRRETRKFRATREDAQLIMRWSAAIPANPEMQLLSPYPRTPQTIGTLAEAKVLRPPLVSESLAREVQHSPGAGSAGVLERVRRVPGGLSFRGWAHLPELNAPADCVVIGYEAEDGTWKPWTAIQARKSRSRENDERIRHSGFERTVHAPELPRGTVTFRGWSIDLQNGEAWPMAGAVTLDFPP